MMSKWEQQTEIWAALKKDIWNEKEHIIEMDLNFRVQDWSIREEVWNW